MAAEEEPAEFEEGEVVAEELAGFEGVEEELAGFEGGLVVEEELAEFE